MRIDEIESRKAEIREMLKAEDTSALDIDALTEEVRALDTEKKEIEERSAKEAELRSAVAPEVIEEIKKNEKKEDRKVMSIAEVRKSNEYAVAFAKFLAAGMKDDTECRALLSVNGTDSTSPAITGYVPVPEFLETEIKTAWEEHQLLGLCKQSYFKGNVKVGFELSATGAVVHAEGRAAPSEEVITLGTVEIKAENIKKWITVSDEAIEGTTVDTLGYLYKEIAHKITEKAEELIIAKIEAAPASASATAVGVPVLTVATPAEDTVVNALAQLSAGARDIRIVMNRATYPVFRSLELNGNYAIDVFEGLRDKIVFSDKIEAYSAVTAGKPYMIIGDFANGFQCNFPNGYDMSTVVDNLSLAEKDLVKIVGRQYVGMAVVGDKHFVSVIKEAASA